MRLCLARVDSAARGMSRLVRMLIHGAARRTGPRRSPGALLGPLLLMLVVSACGGGDDGPVTSADTTATTSTSPTSTAASGATTTEAPSSTTTAPPGQVISVTVRGGQVQGPSRHRVERNEMVKVRVTSDVADEIHVHGYDKTAPVAAGTTAEVSFVASIPGVFEVEFERSHKVLFSLEVRS